jgi:hypothetical protein
VILWKRPRRLAATATLAFLLVSVLSCGGGNSSGVTGGTPSGSYTITVRYSTPPVWIARSFSAISSFVMAFATVKPLSPQQAKALACSVFRLSWT